MNEQMVAMERARWKGCSLGHEPELLVLINRVAMERARWKGCSLFAHWWKPPYSICCNGESAMEGMFTSDA